MKNISQRQSLSHVVTIENLRKLFLGLLITLPACSSSPYQKSDHFDGEKFFNPGVQVNKGLLQVLKWQWQGGKKDWPEWIPNQVKPQLDLKISNQEASLTYVNHATHLIQLPGMTILTDPIFSKRASPFSWAGPKRHRDPGLSIEQLPQVDLVLISHNHYDHMDLPSIQEIAKRFNPTFLVPLGNKKIIEKAGAQKVIELDWWQHMEIGNGGKVHVVPVQHWSARTPFDTNECLWSGFVIQANGLNLYFGGDTGYGPHFVETKKRLGIMDVSILPIGAYEPRWFMKEQHMNPEEAIQAHLDLESQFSIGTHFGTFQLTNEGVDDPVLELKNGLKKAGISETVFISPQNGETSFYGKKK